MKGTIISATTFPMDDVVVIVALGDDGKRYFFTEEYMFDGCNSSVNQIIDIPKKAKVL